MTAAGSAEPTATAKPAAYRIAAMLEIRLSFGRSSCKAAAFPEKAQTRRKYMDGFDLIIFDCDGVLVDSEIIAAEVESGLLTEAGYPIDAEEMGERFAGMTWHNILLQIRGRKTMTIFPAGDEALVDGEAHETFHNGGHRNLPWRDSFAERGRAFALAPGEAVYVPVKAPHWVKNGPEVSISFSITWRSEWSFREEYARRMNALLRKAGLNPASPRRYPHQNHLKSFGYRVVDKAKRTARRDPA